MKNVAYQDTSDKTGKAAGVAQKRSNNWPMMSFIHDGNERTAWMGYSFKTKSTKFKATFLKIRRSFLNLKLQIIRLAKEK